MNIPLNAAGKAAVTSLAVACASLALVTTGAQAQSHGGRGGGHSAHGGGSGWHGGGGHHASRHHGGGHRGGHGNGWVWGGVGLGLGLGLASYYNSYPSYYAAPRYVVVDTPVVVDAPRTVYSQPVPSRVYSTVPQQPVIYPRNGQSAAQTDADANTCSEWAGQQRNATSDASVFHRATQACMDARGYTVR